MKPIVKKTLIGAGIAAVAFFLYKKFSSGTSLSSLDKMTKDAFDSTTQLGKEVKNYLTTTPGKTYDDQSIRGVVAWHMANVTTQAKAYLAKPMWGSDEVVTYYF